MGNRSPKIPSDSQKWVNADESGELQTKVGNCEQNWENVDQNGDFATKSGKMLTNVGIFCQK